MHLNSAIKEVLQVLVVTFLTVCVVCFGGYGQELYTNEQTTEGWRIWGAFLFMLIIILPAAGFWAKQLRKLFNLED